MTLDCQSSMAVFSVYIRKGFTNYGGNYEERKEHIRQMENGKHDPVILGASVCADAGTCGAYYGRPAGEDRSGTYGSVA